MKREIRQLLEDQQGVVARWQLVEAGCSDAQIAWLVSSWRTLHHGVYLTGHAPVTPWQRWFAATLTETGTVLARWSVAAHHGLRTAKDEEPVHVLRAGSGGRRKYARTRFRLDALDLRYSETLAGDVTTVDGIPMTTVARALFDLCAATGAEQRDRLFRDAIRLRKTTRDELRDVARRHRGQRGAGRLRALLSTYEAIPIERTRSDAEIEGLVVLEHAGLPRPEVNIQVAGYEADLVDLDRRVIVELDGPSYHQFPERDAARNRAWRAAGFTVVRRPTDDTYTRPDAIVDAMRGVSGTEQRLRSQLRPAHARGRPHAQRPAH